MSKTAEGGVTASKTIEEVKGEIQRDIAALTASFAKHQEAGFSSMKGPHPGC